MAQSSQNESSAKRDRRRNQVVAVGLLLFLALYAATVTIAAAVVQALDGSLIHLTAEQHGPIFEVIITHGALAVVCLLVYLAVRRHRTPHALPRILLAILPLLMLLSFDRVLNVIFPPPLPRPGIYEPHPRRGWTHEPGAHMAEWADVYIDDDGLRVPKAKWHRKLGDRPRILFVGDSVTFGYLLPADADFVEVVDRTLAHRQSSPGFITLNGGTTAYAPSQELDWLEHEGAALSPDLVIVQICLNDITSGFHAAAGWDPSVHPEFAQIDRHPHWSAFARIAFEWGREKAYGKNLAAAAEKIEELRIDELFEPVESDRVRRAWERALNDWKQMVAFCKARDLAIVFLLVPARSQVVDEAPSDKPQQKLRAFAADEHAFCLDLMPILRARYHDGKHPIHDLYLDHTHPSRVGNEIIGAAIVDFLDRNGLLARAIQHRQSHRG